MKDSISRLARWSCMAPLASWACGPVRRTGGRAPREGIERNPPGSTLLARDAGPNLERNFVGKRDWAFRLETAKPECSVCFASVQVKYNRKFFWRKREIEVVLARSRRGPGHPPGLVRKYLDLDGTEA